MAVAYATLENLEDQLRYALKWSDDSALLIEVWSLDTLPDPDTTPKRRMDMTC